MDYREFLKSAAHVKPSRRQLHTLSEVSFYAFIHFGPNTYMDYEWGYGAEDPKIFNPENLDCDAWVEAIKSAGMKGVVITAKHHDGFCLWQTKYTEHSMKNSLYKNGKGDVVKELSDACKRGGIEFGFYLSPWDRNSKLYGTDEYNTYYKNQLTELLTGYGKIFHVWFDGACGEGPNGKKQVYDFDGYIELIRKYQPDATIFHDGGPDIRWCGNEAGVARHAEWAVVPKELCKRAKSQTEGALLEGDLSHMYNSDSDIGTLSNIMYSKGLVFCPAEVDMSIRQGWFYHSYDEPHSLERLFDTYINSVGGNASFILNIPPMPSGRFDDKDIARLKELGDKIKESFREDFTLEDGAAIEYEKLYDTQSAYTVTLPEKKKIKYIVLEEDIKHGQRVESFVIGKRDGFGNWLTIYSAFTIGNKKICPVNIKTNEIRVHITASRDETLMKKISIY